MFADLSPYFNVFYVQIQNKQMEPSLNLWKYDFKILSDIAQVLQSIKGKQLGNSVFLSKWSNRSYDQV